MQGRLEQQNILFNKLESKLRNYPKFIYSWYLSLRASDCSAKTCKDYINKASRLLESIDKDISKVTENDITYNNVSKYFISTKTKCDSQGNLVATSDSYQQSIWCCINNLVSFLYEQKMISNNFMKQIRKPKNKDLARINENRVLLDELDFKRILESVENGCGSSKAHSFQKKMKDRDMAIMLIFMTTGIRKSALSEINISDLDLINGELSVIDKGDIWRKCALTDNAINHLNSWLKYRGKIAKDTEALFVSYQGKRMSNTAIDNLVKKYCEDALGYEISPHKLRSGFITIMYRQTGDIEKVRRMVGHANVATTQRYIVTNQKERYEAKDIMAGIVG